VTTNGVFLARDEEPFETGDRIALRQEEFDGVRLEQRAALTSRTPEFLALRAYGHDAFKKPSSSSADFLRKLKARGESGRVPPRSRRNAVSATEDIERVTAAVRSLFPDVQFIAEPEGRVVGTTESVEHLREQIRNQRIRIRRGANFSAAAGESDDRDLSNRPRSWDRELRGVVAPR